MKTTEQESTQESMKQIMERLKNAVVSLDAEGVLALCRDSDEFLIVVDEVMSAYDQFAANERHELKMFQQIRLTFDSLQIRVLGADVVAALCQFHQVLTDGNGVEIPLKGEFTWIANRVEGGPWLLTYAHAWHRPDPAAVK